jgi:hypothetical protein
MILTDRDDPYLVATALSSATRHPGPLVAEVLTAEPPADPRLLAQVLAASAAGDGGEVAAGVAAELESPRLAKSIDRQFALAAALLDAGLRAAGGRRPGRGRGTAAGGVRACRQAGGPSR